MRSDKSTIRSDSFRTCRVFVCLALVLGSLGVLPGLMEKKFSPGQEPEGVVLYKWGRGATASTCNLYRISGAEKMKIAAQPLPEKLKPFFYYPMDLSRVSAGLLQTVPGIGPALARRIVLTREKKGAFRKLDELARIQGIGKAKLASLKLFLTVDSAPISLQQRNFSYPAAISHNVQD